MNASLSTFLLFSSLIALLTTGIPLTFCLGAVAIIFTILLWGFPAILQITSTAFGMTLNIVLLAIPLFIFMANILENSGIAEDLYKAFYLWMGKINGGLAMGTIIICALFAAMSGISGAATVSMGVIAIPSMLHRKYNKYMSVGCVAAGGSLGILIPPSVVMIIYATFSGCSVGKLFAAGIVPGILLSIMYIVYVSILCFVKADYGPALPIEERVGWIEKLKVTKSVILPLLLILSVIGSIFLGLATPTEAAAMGAVGSIICAFINKRLNWSTFKKASEQTLNLSTMILWIIIAAACFCNVYIAIGAPDLLSEIISNLGLGKWQVLFIIQLSFFLLGMFMDPTGIVILTTPIYVPIITELGFDPIWFGILFIVNMEMGYITPPFGYNLFYMRSVVPDNVMTMKDIYISVLPFILIQILCLVLIMIFPEIALWLPSLLKN